MRSLFLIVAALIVAGGCRKADPAPVADKADPAKEPTVKVPAKAGPGDTAAWTHKELIAHLRSKGLTVTVEGGSTPAGLPFSCLFESPTADRDFAMVVAMLHKSPQEAKEHIGALAGESFTWGRFSFYTADKPREIDRIYISRIKNALP